jgi:hypothetical protein
MFRITLAIAVATATGCTVGDSLPSDAGAAVDPDDTPPIEPLVANRDQIAFDYFRNQGLTRIQAAGIVGNLIQESGVDPTAIQYGGGPGRGIAQWSVGGRWNSGARDSVSAYASAHGLSRWSMTAQLDFIWFELTNYGYGYSSLKAATTVTAAVKAFQDRYEICGACDTSRRIADAESVLSRF